MRRGWVSAIVLAGLVLGLRGLAGTAERASAARSTQRARSPGSGTGPELGLDPAASALALPPVSAAEAAREPQPLFAARSVEMERAHWVEGRVNFPAGTSDDEVCFVVADGRPFADGTLHRTRVGPDGRFRVAFSPGAKAGWIGLEARYLYLEGRSRWLLARAEEEVTLAPRLGGVVVGRLVLPAGARTRSPSGEIELRSAEPETGLRRISALRAGEFTFERVPCGSALTLEYRGAAWIARSSPFGLAPGRTERVELELVAGVVLGGEVRDERGRKIEGARILALGSIIDTRSRGDGSFRLPALEAGPHTLHVSCAGYLPAKRELGLLVAGARRTNLLVVLERGAAITGKVLHPDGSPAEANVRVTPERPHPPGQRSVSTRCASDGTFELHGLLPGAYRLDAWKKPQWERGTAFGQRVEAGSTGLELRLGSGFQPGDG